MKKYYLLVLLVCIQSALAAQLTLTVNMSFEPDPDVLNWAAHPETVQLTVTNTSDQTLEYKYLGRLTHNGQLVLDNDPGKMPTETIGPFETRISFAEDIFPSDAVEIHGNSAETYMKTNTIPGGQYLICIKLINLSGQDLSPDNCKPFQITTYQQPALIFPTSSSHVTSIVRPIFSWSPVVPMPMFPVNYRLRVVEVPENVRSWVPTDEPGYHKEPRWGSKEWMPKLLAIQEAGGSITEYEAAVGIEIFYREDRKVTGVWRQAAHPGGCRCILHSPKDYRIAHDQLSSDALRALNYGYPLIDVEVGNQTQYQWPMDLPDPMADKSYVWSVQAFRSDNGLPIGDNDGLSQPAQFFVTEEGANANDLSRGGKAPDIIIADENGCLYGCTGNVWQPIDCPTERSFASPDTYPFTFLLTSTEEGSEKQWFLVDETTTDEPITSGPMMPISRFALADKVADSTTRTTTKPEYLDPGTTIITGRGGIKLCWTPQGCVIVEGDEPCPDITWNYLIEVVTTPNISQTTKAPNKQPEVTLEQIQPFLVELVKAKEPMYLSLNKEGKLTNVNSVVDCEGDYCLTLTVDKDSLQTDEEIEDPITRIWVCYLPALTWIPSCVCYLGWDAEDLEEYTGFWSGGPCYYNGTGWPKDAMPNFENGTIALRMPDGIGKCLMPDGSYGLCNGVLPSIKEIQEVNEEAKANSTLIGASSKTELLDFYLRDIYSDSGFVMFTPQPGQGANAEKKIKYASDDSRYKDWSVIFSPDITQEQQWLVIEPGSSGQRTNICITTECHYFHVTVTVSCYSACTASLCCKLFEDWWYPLRDISVTHDHPAGFDPACPKCQKNASTAKGIEEGDWNQLRIPDGRYLCCTDAAGEHVIVSTCASCCEEETCGEVVFVTFGRVPPPEPGISNRQIEVTPPAIDIFKLNTALKNSPKGQNPLFFQQSVSGDIQSIASANDCAVGYFLIKMTLGDASPITRASNEWVPVEVPYGYCCLHNGSLSSPVSDCSKCRKGECYKFKDKKVFFHMPTCDQRDNRRTIPDLTPITKEKMAELEKLSPDETTIMVSQNPETGELKNIETPADCPKGHFLIFLETNDKVSADITGKVTAVNPETKTYTILINAEEFTMSSETIEEIPKIGSLINFSENPKFIFPSCEKCKAAGCDLCFLMPELYCRCYFEHIDPIRD